MRLFVAVELPEKLREDLTRGIAELRAALPRARWVRPEGIHITLKFLGEQPEATILRLDAGVGPRLATLAPVTVTPLRGGFFPGEHRPRVAWLGGTAPGLEVWAEAVETVAEELGIPRERRPFALHLTLARLDRPWPAPAVDRYLRIVEDWRLVPFIASEAILFSSRLGRGGAVYTAQRRWPVAKGA